MNKLFKFYIDYRIKQTLKKYNNLKELHFINIIYKYDGNIILRFAYLNENDFSGINTDCKQYCEDCDCNKFKRLETKVF